MRTFRISRAFTAGGAWEVRAPFSFDEWHIFMHCSDGATGSVLVDYGIGGAVKIAVDGSPFVRADVFTNNADGKATLPLILDAKSPKLFFTVTQGDVTTLTIYVVASQKGASPLPDVFPTTIAAACNVE